MNRSVLIPAACLAAVVFCTAVVVHTPPENVDAEGHWPAAVALPHADAEAQRALDALLRTSQGRVRRVRGLTRLALKFYEKGNVEGALELLRAAVKIAPDEAGLHAAIGIICAENNRLKEAETSLSRYIEASEHEDAFALLLLGIVYLQQRKYAAAAATLTRVLRLHPEWTRARCALAAAFARLGRESEAVYHLRIAARDPETDILPLLAQPEFDSLRDRPAFRALVAGLLRRAGGPAASSRSRHGSESGDTE